MTEFITTEAQAALIAQLHYDRSDIALVSQPAAAAMDIVIAMVMAALRDIAASAAPPCPAEVEQG